ncbi:hypothetical protein B0H13DRAFT_2066447 [Mycena leptocephala]|nr:hypothetical protein B0H13DRAFT_2066447 [Mycena leptocephala]
MQAQDFVRKYGIPTVAINEDTPDSVLLWQKIEAGEIPHLIVQPEQFRLTHGHLPRMAKLLHNRHFVSKVTRVALCYQWPTAFSSRSRRSSRPATKRDKLASAVRYDSKLHS